MPRPRPPAWTFEEIAILREFYPTGGLNAVCGLLPDRSWRSIYVKANQLGLRCEALPDAPRCKLEGEALNRAVRLREVEGWSFARIGAELGFCESTVTNAVIIEQCHRNGFTPAQRLPNGRLAPEGLERLRLMLKKGMKAVDIQLRLGLSASCVAEQRRRYNRDLKARGKALLPPPGGGIAYSGVKIPAAKKREVEALFLEGFGTLKVSQRSGVSKTVCVRIRARLVKRLRRKGECLPGCDLEGKRHVMRGHARAIPEETKAKLRQLILERVPVRRAAALCGIGSCTAYRYRDELKAELGELPSPRLPGRVGPLRREMLYAGAIPPEKLYRFRKLVHRHGDEEARRILRAEIAEERKSLPFEERLKRLNDPSQIVANFKPSKVVQDSLIGSSGLSSVEAA